MATALYRVGIADSDKDFTERAELEDAIAHMHRYMRRGTRGPYATRVRRPGHTWSRQRFDAPQIEQRVRESLTDLDVGDVVVVRRSDGDVIVVRVAKPMPEPKGLFHRVPVPCGRYIDGWGADILAADGRGIVRNFHCQRTRIRPDGPVKAGDHCANVDNTGNALHTDAHSHFELHPNPAELRPGRLREHRGRRVLARRNRMRSHAELNAAHGKINGGTRGPGRPC